MDKPNRAQVRAGAAVALLIALAVACRFAGNSGYLRLPLGLLRSAIYLGLFAAWGLSVRTRIIQTQARRYLTAVAAIMVLWILLRTLKYYFVPQEAMPLLTRQLWYWYYFPLLYIPMLAVFVAMSLGRPEAYRLPRWTGLLYLPAAALLALTVTNDLHQLVFTFPAEATVWSDGDNGYGPGYMLILGWELFCALTAFAIMLRKCRLRRGRGALLLPLLPFAAAVLYGFVYVSGARWLRFAAGDMTVVFCLFFAAVLDSCIRCGLIQSNTRYRELFRASSIGARITDGAYRVLLSSQPNIDIPGDTMRRTEAGPVMLTGSLRLSGAPISGGHVLWTEDVSALTLALEELEDANEYLRGRNMTLAEEYRTSSRRRRLAEQNRLYNEMQDQTAPVVSLLQSLVDSLDRTEDAAEERELLLQVCVLGIYIKRRNNLIFLSQERPEIPASELRGCVEEIVRGFQLFGVDSDYRLRVEESLPFSSLTYLYDALAEVMEATAARVSAMYIALGFEEGRPTMIIQLSGPASLPDFRVSGLTAEREDDREWRLSCRAPAGGGQ